MTKNRQTAGELLAEIAADPKLGPRYQQRREEMRRRREASIQQQAKLLGELRQVGWDIETVYDLLKVERPYAEAIPVLVAHLGRPYMATVREGIARALTVPEAKPHLPRLIEEFRKDPDPSLNGPKWALGNAIEALGGHKEHLQEIVELVLDPAHGPARDRLVYALGKSKDPIASETLEAVKDDPDIHLDVAKVQRQREKKRQRDAQRQAERQAEKQKP